MFKKILIANRGEIACRVIKTAKAMGLETVAVYSDADKDALHVRMADEAVHIGASPAGQSYLLIDKIIETCKTTGADCVHPGYGFLSERADFCEALSKAGVTFIGPPPKAIEAMGDKITSKKIAQEANVSTVPGHMGLIDDAEHAVKIATEIGYPVMIKASAGGGGKGMRIAWDDAEAREGFERSKSEAASSFGDDRIFIEKFIEEPRHIEIQVLADQHGNCIYLGERECSIQRRNQKVIEEAPSPFLDEKTRKAMGEQSCALAVAVGYTSAGTIEFIVDKNQNFYFLEMNTRLQVEHPVTEMITGVDLVEQMIKVANGTALSLKQSDVKLNGWAMESRLYAEDPYRNFLPSIGRLTRYRPPAEEQGDTKVVRNDTGVFEGGEISMFYDPMIAKLCTWAPDRASAIAAMETALNGFEVEGVGHNIPFLSAVMGHERFQSGQISTNFIAEEYPEGFEGVTPNDEQRDVIIAAALIAHHLKHERIAKRNSAFAKAPAPRMTLVAQIGRAQTEAMIEKSDETYLISIAGKDYECASTYQLHHTLMQLTMNGERIPIKIERDGAAYRLRYCGIDARILIMRPDVARLSAMMPEKLPPDMSSMLLCPMPGLVVKLMVKEGEKVEEGQSLAIVEAMKMENVLTAERAATVAKVLVSEGESLAVDAVMLEFE